MITLLFNSLIALILIVFLIKGFLNNIKENSRLAHYIGLLACLYSLFFVLNIFWLIGTYSFLDSDLLTLSGIILVIQSFIFYFLVDSIRSTSFSKFLPILYTICLFLIFLSPLNFSLFAPIISLFFILLVLFNLIDSSHKLIRRMGYLSLIYSSLSILLFLFLLFSEYYLKLFVSFSILLFIPVTYYLSFKFPPKENVHRVFTKNKHFFTTFLKYLIFISALTNIVLISTLSIHELSHVVAARFYDCDAKAIFFEKGFYPYSQINCDNSFGDKLKIIALAGPILPVFLAFLLFLLDNHILRSISLLVMGFNILAGYRDFKEVNLSSSIILFISLAGAILLLLGLFYLSKFVFNEENKNN